MKIKARKYAAEAAAAALPRQPCDDHPLKSTATRLSIDAAFASEKLKESSNLTKGIIDDPLAALSMQSVTLTDEAVHNLPRSSQGSIIGTIDEQANVANRRWDAYKSLIVQRCTSSGTITVSANFDIMSKEPKGRGKSLIAAHLEELEEPEKGIREEVKVISQQEYVARLRELNGEIRQAWTKNERVAALRLTVKVAKLLSDTSVPQFYPTLFVLVSDVMDTVGNLVWDRIKNKAEIDESGNLRQSLPANFTAIDVCQEAKDTCSNWFMKIGSIRELLPRIYLEIAILRCILFLDKRPLPVFQRLMSMIRGLSDPLASAYVRLYLARRGLAIIPLEVGYLVSGLQDYLFLFKRVLLGEFDKTVIATGIQRQPYVALVEPFIEWTMQCIFIHSSQEAMASLVNTFDEMNSQACQQNSGARKDYYLAASFVHYILKVLPSTFISHNALKMLQMVNKCTDSSMSQHLNYVLLGRKLCECNPPRKLCLPILKDVWKVVVNFQNLLEYLAVADVFVEYILQCCTDNEVKEMLDDIVTRIHKSKVNEEALSILESIVFKLVTHYVDLTQLLALDLTKILDTFYGDIQKSVYKHILLVVSRSHHTIKDPVTRNFAFELSRVLHDSLDSLSSEDDRRQITHMVARFVQLVDHGQDLEQHSAFLVDCRAKFTNMESVKEVVIHASSCLAATAIKKARVLYNGHTTNFVKACVTFNEITIPSITKASLCLHLYLETAEVALSHGLISHTEGLLKSALTFLKNIDSEKDLKLDEVGSLQNFLFKLLAFLIIVPGNSTFGAFYLLRGVCNLLDTAQWLTNSWYKVRVFCGVLNTTAALAQEELPYHTCSGRVNSNDELFFGDVAYQEEVANTASFVFDKILEELDEIAYSEPKGNQMLEVSTTFLTVFVVSEEIKQRCTIMISNAASMLAVDNALLTSTVAFARSKGLEISLADRRQLLL